MQRHPRIGAALAAIGLAVVPSVAFAEARANHQQSQRISTAVHRSRMTNGVPDKSYDVTNIWVSTKPKGWAKATMKPKKGSNLLQTRVVLQFKKGKWTVFGVGSTCGVPGRVLKDLKLGSCGY